LYLFAKQTHVKGDVGKCGNGKDDTIRITIQNVFIGVAEFGQERDVVTRMSGGFRRGSMQNENARQYLGEQMEGRGQIRTESAGSETQDCTPPQSAKNIARIYR
jgi:hypothetical protein